MKIQFSPEIGRARDEYSALRKTVALQLDSARQKWNDLSIKQIDEATTKEEVMAAFKSAPWGTSARTHAMEKLAEVCSTKQELLEAYEESRGRRFWDDEHPVLLKFEAIVRSEIDSATSLDEAEAVYWSALGPVGSAYGASGVHQEALKKLLSLCTTVEMLQDIVLDEYILDTWEYFWVNSIGVR